MPDMLHLEPIPSFEDNYVWAIHDGHSAVLVDPGEAAPVLAWLRQYGLTPVAVLLTHHHGDHCGGLAELLDHYDPAVYGPQRDGIAGVDHPLGEGGICVIPQLDLAFTVLAIPGHTLGHLAYFGHGWLFCGDALFSCGCGKVFEGTPAMLHASLVRLGGLPPDTLVCCAHEYTLANLRFALTVEPDNPALLAWREGARSLRALARPTLPVRLADELGRNPFLRCHDPALRKGVEAMAGHPVPADPAALFAVLRELKNAYRPPT